MAKRPKPFAWNPNIGAVNGFGIELPGIGQSASVAATTNTVMTVPALPTSGRTQSAPNGKNLGYAIIKYAPNTECWVAVNEAATQTLTGSFAATDAMLNPECLLVYEGDELNFWSSAGCVVSVMIFPWA